MSNETKTTEKQLSPIAKFHKFNKYGIPTDIIDNEIATAVKDQIEMFVIGGKQLYIYDQGVFRLDENGIHAKAYIKQLIFSELVRIDRIERVYKLLLNDSDLIMKYHDLNRYEDHIINIKNGMLNLKTLHISEHGSLYYSSINQIPFEYNSEFDTTGSVTEEFLNGLIPNVDDRQMFLEYAGYCLTKDISQQKFMIIKGTGGTGKSELIHLVERTVGRENTSPLTIQNVNDRFSPAFLIGKLLNVNADISSEAMLDSAGLKKVVGGDTIRAEIKGGEIFSFEPYVKLLFSANRIPEVKDDKTNAFFRRLLILTVNQRCHEIKHLSKRLEEETARGVFFHMAVRAVHNMYVEDRPIIESQSSKEEIQHFYNSTDSVMAFICEKTETGKDLKETRDRLYNAYCQYCSIEGRTAKTRNGFYQNLRDKGVRETKINGIRYFIGLTVI